MVRDGVLLIEDNTGPKSPMKVDREAGIIHDVLVLGPISRNKRKYSDKALNKAVLLLEGLKVNFDHSTDRTELGAQKRKWKEWFGQIEGLHRTPDGVRGNLKFLKHHAEADNVCDAAERMPECFGLSPALGCASWTL